MNANDGDPIVFVLQGWIAGGVGVLAGVALVAVAIGLIAMTLAGASVQLPVPAAVSSHVSRMLTAARRVRRPTPATAAGVAARSTVVMIATVEKGVRRRAIRPASLPFVSLSTTAVIAVVGPAAAVGATAVSAGPLVVGLAQAVRFWQANCDEINALTGDDGPAAPMSELMPTPGEWLHARPWAPVAVVAGCVAIIGLGAFLVLPIRSS